MPPLRGENRLSRLDAIDGCLPRCLGFRVSTNSIHYYNPSHDLHLTGQVTALTASMMFELHLQQQGLRFSKGNNADAVQFNVPFAGYKYTITFRESSGVLATMNATLNEKIGSSQRAEATIFFAMVRRGNKQSMTSVARQ